MREKCNKIEARPVQSELHLDMATQLRPLGHCLRLALRKREPDLIAQSLKEIRCRMQIKCPRPYRRTNGNPGVGWCGGLGAGGTNQKLSALVYHNFLPVLLMGVLPTGFVARSYALNRLDFPRLGSQRPETTPKPDSRVLPFTAVGFLSAFVALRKVRPILASYGLVCFLIFTASIQAPPLPNGGPQADQTLTGGPCHSGK